jgi:hypothetical protein
MSKEALQALIDRTEALGFDNPVLESIEEPPPPQIKKLLLLLGGFFHQN